MKCPYCDADSIINNGSGRSVCKSCSKTFKRSAILRDAEPIATKSKAKRFVITAAVSGAYAHKPFLATLRGYCDLNDAELLVVPVRYHNPTSKFDNPGEWYDPEVVSHLVSVRTELMAGLILAADVTTQPTAARPLSGLTSFGGTASIIFGHPKIALETVATAPGTPAKVAVTTGALTRPTYSESKAGKKGEFHHVLGALVIELEGDQFHLRHLRANTDGSFYDLDKKYDDNSETSPQGLAKVLTIGDLHAVRANRDVLNATFFAKDSMVQTLKPRNIVLHDTLDFQSASHHNSFFQNVKLAKQGRRSVIGELRATASLLDAIAGSAEDAAVWVIESNHDNHLNRWLSRADNALDIENTQLYHTLKATMLDRIMGDEKDVSPFVLMMSLLCKSKNLKFLTSNDSLVFDGTEYAQHGDRGPNGVKGTRQSFVNLGMKATIGHSHTPGITDGVYQVGTSSELDLGYNTGFSSWAHCHCVHYSNGKRSLLFVKDGKWRA